MRPKFILFIFIILGIKLTFAQPTNPPQRKELFTKELVKAKFKLSKEKFQAQIDLSRIDTNAIYIREECYGLWQQDMKAYFFLRFFKDAVFFSGAYLTPPTDEQAEDLSYGTWRCYTFDKRSGNLVIEIPRVVRMSSGPREYFFGEFTTDSLKIIGSIPQYPKRKPNICHPQPSYYKRPINFKNRNYHWFPQQKSDLDSVKYSSECFLSFDEVWTSLKPDSINTLGGSLDLLPAFPEISKSASNFEIRLYKEGRFVGRQNSMLKLACVNGRFASTLYEYQTLGVNLDSMETKVISVKEMKCKEYEMFFIDSLKQLNFFDLTNMEGENCYQEDTVEMNGQQFIRRTTPEVLDGTRYIFQFKIEDFVHTSYFVNPLYYTTFCPYNQQIADAAKIVTLFYSYFEEK